MTTAETAATNPINPPETHPRPTLTWQEVMTNWNKDRTTLATLQEYAVFLKQQIAEKKSGPFKIFFTNLLKKVEKRMDELSPQANQQDVVGSVDPAEVADLSEMPYPFDYNKDYLAEANSADSNQAGIVRNAEKERPRKKLPMLAKAMTCLKTIFKRMKNWWNEVDQIKTPSRPRPGEGLPLVDQTNGALDLVDNGDHNDLDDTDFADDEHVNLNALPPAFLRTRYPAAQPPTSHDPIDRTTPVPPPRESGSPKSEPSAVPRPRASQFDQGTSQQTDRPSAPPLPPPNDVRREIAPPPPGPARVPSPEAAQSNEQIVTNIITRLKPALGDKISMELVKKESPAVISDHRKLLSVIKFNGNKPAQKELLINMGLVPLKKVLKGILDDAQIIKIEDAKRVVEDFIASIPS